MPPRASRAAEIRTDLRRRIAAGEYEPGDRLPRLQDLMSEYGVRSRSAIDRVLRDLVSEGVLTVVQGSGIYVRRRHIVRRDLAAALRLEHQRAISGETYTEGLFEAATGTTDLEVAVAYDRIEATDRIAEALAIPTRSPILRRTFRYAIAGSPHQVAQSHLPVELADAAGLAGPDSEQPGTSTIAQLHAAGVTVDQVQVTLETRMPTADERTDLAIPPGTPVYEHWRVMFSESRPVEVSTAVVPGDRVAYVLNVDLGGDRE